MSDGKPAAMFSMISSRKAGYFMFAQVGVVFVIVYFLWHSYSSNYISWKAPTALGLPKTTNVAAIIEDRPLSNLVPLLLHFATVLGPEWPIVFFAAENSLFNTSIPFRRAVDAGRIQIRSLPPDTHFENHAAVSDLLTTPWFWEELAPAGHVLLFQADSILCANSDSRVEDFLEYDFVGAPIDVPVSGDAGHGEGYNGGLSLRNRTMILDIVKRFSWKGEKESGQISQAGCVTKEPCLKFEDQWFYHKMKEIPGSRLPSKEIASKFAVETIWYDTPLGYHQVDRWNSDKMDKVAEWCPEYKMATTELLVKNGKTAPERV